MFERKREKTIFQIALRSLLLALALQFLLLVGSFAATGVTRRINRNAEEILAKQVENRSGYLTADLALDYACLNKLTDIVNSTLEAMLASGEASLADLNGAGGEELLCRVCPDLADGARERKVTGVFLLLNTQDLAAGAPEDLPGLYLRMPDPLSMAAKLHAEVLALRAPEALLAEGKLTMGEGWQPAFSAADGAEQPFFYQPYQAAVSGKGRLAAEDCGYWTTAPYILSGQSKGAIAYAQPLILPDGTVYGVLGVEFLTDYIHLLLPHGELMEGERGSYLLACGKVEENGLSPVALAGDAVPQDAVSNLRLRFVDAKRNVVTDETGKRYGAASALPLYGAGSPFHADQWYLVGFANRSDLHAFSTRLRRTVEICFLFTILTSVGCVFLLSYRISKPVRALSEELEKASRLSSLSLSSLPGVGIREIDQFLGAISRLQHEVADSSARFAQIIHLSSVDLAGYELREGTEQVYVTENYFPLMGAYGVDTKTLTVDRFREIKQEVKRGLETKTLEDGSIIYALPQPGGKMRYLRSNAVQDGGRLVGLLEDVTASTLERKQVEWERDSDVLTRLYGRQGFRRKAEELFAQPGVMRQAALVLLDLDNLKTTNDRFGHNYGDRYIQTMGRCLSEHTPEGTVCARMGGDEFVLLLYGYADKEKIRKALQALREAICGTAFVLPDGKDMGLSASGGVAWYPEDSDSLPLLLKYADFAMYQAKREKKGTWREFEPASYRRQYPEDQNRLEFYRMLEGGKVNYFFQPIFRADGGDVYGYEALMRVEMPNLRDPRQVLQIAGEEDALRQIEKLTMFRATEDYAALLEQEAAQEGALLFINSVGVEDMTLQEEQEYHERFSAIQGRLVLELAGTERMDPAMIRNKSVAQGFPGVYALDDYRGDYYSEASLETLQPAYVKIDMSLVRDVDADESKRRIVANIVRRAHGRGIKVIAKGVETGAELQALLDLEVDLLQGFFLARPGAVPPALTEDARLLLWDRGGA